MQNRKLLELLAAHEYDAAIKLIKRLKAAHDNVGGQADAVIAQQNLAFAQQRQRQIDLQKRIKND